MSRPLSIAVTGATGNVAYAFLFRLVAGEVFGPGQPLHLRLQDIESQMGRLEGVVLELEDAASPLLSSVEMTSDPKVAFDGVSWAALLGSARREASMERGDLIRANGQIFGPIGMAINETAGDDVRVVVVGNPCNTNCLIAQSNAPDVPSDRWFAMVALDRNRARSMIARQAGVELDAVKNLAIWGNHSSTQVPDAENALVEGRAGREVLDTIAAARERAVAMVTTRSGVLSQGWENWRRPAEWPVPTDAAL